MNRSAIVCLLILLSLNVNAVKPDGSDFHPNGIFEHAGVKESPSQFIRSNPFQYWVRQAHFAAEGPLANYLKAEGFGEGDLHMRQMVIDRVRETSTCAEKLAMVNGDFDDMGIAPFVLFFARYVATIKAEFADIHKRDLEAAYIQGLKGVSFPMPVRIQKLLDMSVEDYQSELTEYVAKRTTKTRFEYKDGEIEKYPTKNRPIPRSTINTLFETKLFPGERVMDVAVRPKDRGGSVDAPRLWVYLKRKSDGHRRIVELKGYLPTGVRGYRLQPSPMDLFEMSQAAFRPGLDPSSYNLVEIPGAGLYWIREKRVALLEIPGASDSNSDQAFAQELALYVANLQGLGHGAQDQGPMLLKDIETDPAAFHQALEAEVDSYLKEARAGLKSGE